MEERWFDQVSSVQDQVGPLQVWQQALRQGFGAPGDVRVGEDDG